MVYLHDISPDRALSPCPTSDDERQTRHHLTEYNGVDCSALAISNNEVEVPRRVNLISGVSFIVGSIIGSGIFISPRGIASKAGSVGFTMVCWVLCGVISMLGALCYAELGTIIKESGADYTYLFVAYGSVVSYLNSWVMNLLVKPASLTVISLTCAQYLMTLVFTDSCGGPPMIITKLLAAIVILLLCVINGCSSQLASKIQILFTIAKLFALAIIITGGLTKITKGSASYIVFEFANTETNPGKVAVGLYSGMWAYDGWNTVNFLTEEIIKPERNLPLSIFIGVPLVMVIYVLTNVSYFTVMSFDELIASPAVAVTWAERVIPGAVWLIPVFVAFSTFGAGNGLLFSGCRSVFAAARNYHLPGVLAMVHCEQFTPIPAVFLTCFLSIVFLIPGDIGVLIAFVSFLQWIFYSMNMLAVVILRFHKNYKDIPRPIKTPLIVPVLAFLTSVSLVLVPIVTDPRAEFLYALVLIAIGFIFWLPFVHLNLNLQFMERVTASLQLFFRVLRPKKNMQ